MTEKKRFLDTAYTLTDGEPSARIKAHYDAWAEHYDEELVDENAYVMPDRAAAAIAAHVDNRQARILDVGCGTGLSGAALVARGFNNLDGCDLSPGMLQKARTLGIYERLFEADLTQPPLDVPADTYDVVTVVGAFSFSHIPVDAMDDLLRTVKRGGHFLVTVNDHYFGEGTLQPKLDALCTANIVAMRLAEHGAHIKARNVGGWVFLMQKL